MILEHVTTDGAIDLVLTLAPMYCIKCGTANPDAALYCKKCGFEFEPEEETRVATRQTDNMLAKSEPIFSITPTMKFVYAGYVLAIIGAFILALVIGGIAQLLSALGTVVLGLILCLAFLVVPAIYHLRQKLVRYTLTDTTIEIDRGLISRSTQNIPLRRIQDVTVSSTMMQRVLGFGDIVIDNASETGGKVVLDNIDSPRKYVDMLLEQMRRIDRG